MRPSRKSLIRAFVPLFCFAVLVTAASPVSAAKGTGATFLDYAQCANGAPPATSLACPDGWINGILQGSNSHYREGEVTPQRAAVIVPSGSPAQNRTITLTYQARKGTIHAYDSLATWNLTQTAANRCQSLGTNCPNGAESFFPIPDDPTAVGPAGAGISPVTADHMVPAGPGRRMYMFGGTLTNISVPVHDNAGGTGDDYASVVVTYRVPDANNDNKSDTNRKVQLLYGGHLAVGSGDGGWGSGRGSGSISGGPYHIKWTAADGASIGNRDNQIQGAAILAPPVPVLDITKTADDTSVNAGDTMGYTVTFTNNGPSDAENTTLTDALPTGPGISWSIDSDTSGVCVIAGDPQALSCNFGTFAVNATVTVHMISATDESSVGSYENTAVGDASNAEQVTASAETVNVTKPDLDITKTADDTSVNAGDTMGYTVTFTNNGPETAYDATLTDILPAGPGISWSIDSDTSGVCVIAGDPQALSCNLGTFAVNATVTVHMISATDESSVGSYENTAVGDASNAEQVTADAPTVTVTAPPLSIDKVADDTSVNAGDQMGYTVTFTNVGPGDAYNTTLTDVLPSGSGLSWSIDSDTSGVCVIAGDPQTLSCALGTFAAGATVTVHVVSATDESSVGSYENTATGDASNAQEVSATAPTVTVTKPVLVITKTADDTSVTAGETIGYTVTFTNNGPQASYDTTVTDTLPSGPGISWSIASDTSGVCAIAGDPQVLSCDLGTFAEGSSVTIHLISATDESSVGSYENTAVGDASNAEQVTASAETVTVTPPPVVLSLTKTLCETQVPPGGFITYFLEYENIGTVDATNVVMTDTIPEKTEVVDAGGGTVSDDGATVTWDIGTVPVGGGGERTLKLRVVDAADGDVLVNSASITADGALQAFTAEQATTVDNDGAASDADSYGVHATAPDTVLVDHLNRQTTSAAAPAGSDTKADNVAELSQAPIGTVTLIDGTAHSEVDDPTLANASSQATASTARVNLLNGAIKADSLRAVADAAAGPLGAGASSAGSVIQNLTINNIPITDIVPNKHVQVRNPLNPLQIIADAIIYEEVRSAGLDEATGLWKASELVNSLHVTLLAPFQDMPAGAEIIVSHAESHATYPSGLGCGANPPPTVDADAFTASVDGTFGGELIAHAQAGQASIASTGGEDDDHLASVTVPGAVTTTETANTACGSLTNVTACGAPPGSSAPLSFAQSKVADVSILDGLITAEALDVSSRSSAGGVPATTFATTFTRLKIGDEVITGNPTPNAGYSLTTADGDGVVIILNERTSTSSATSTDGTIIAIHVYVFAASGELTGEIKVASAHSAANN